MSINLTPEDIAAIADAVAARLNAPAATMTAAQLAAHWGVTVQTIYRRVNAGTLQPIEGLGVARFRREEIERFERS